MMPDQAMVSCIIIFLNGGTFLEEAIASVLAQSYPHWELLLVDDGSSDGSTALAEHYALQYPKQIHCIEHEGHQNRGMSATRNLGISHACGKYIGFLDADDIWLPCKLEQQVALLEAYPQAGMVYGRTQIWYSWSGSPADAQRDHFYDLGVEPNTLVPAPRLLTQLLRNKYQTPTTCNALMRREVVADVGGFEESFPGMYEDQAFFVKVELASAVFVADTCWARYRQHEHSSSAVAEQIAGYYDTRLPFLSWCERYFSERGITHQQVWQALREEIWPCQHPRLRRFVERSRRIARRLTSRKII